MISSTAGVTMRDLVWCCVVLWCGLVLWHGALLFGTQTFAGGDLVNYFIPVREGQVARGWFAGWQPETFGGRPVLDNIQTGAFYPPNWLHLAGLSVPRAITLLCLAHLFFSGLGMYLCGRERLAHAGALLAALVWTFSGYQQLRLTNGVLVFTLAFPWVPWMLWAAERQSLARGAGLRWAALLALFGAFQLSTGAAQIVQITWVGLAVWTIGRMWCPRGGENRAAIAGGFVLAGVLTLMMCAPVLAGARVFEGEAFPRGQDDRWEFLSDGSAAPRLMWTWVFPEFFAPGSSEELYWGSTVGFSETNVYTGILPLVLAVWFLVCVPWRKLRSRRGEIDEGAFPLRWIAALGVLGVFGFLVALGSHGFLFRALVALVPTFDYFRVPARWLLWTVMAVALLAGMGLDRLLAVAEGWAGRGALPKWGIAAGGAVAFCGVVWLAAPALVEWLGVNAFLAARVPLSAIDALREQMVGFARDAVAWGLAMAAVGGVVGALLAVRRFSAGPLVAVLLLIVVVDLLKFWQPFAQVIPDGISQPDVETEAPFHRIGSGYFREYYYPETELVRYFAEMPERGRIHYDNTLPSFMFDEFQREFLNERPIVFGLELTRGYQQLQLKSYTEDYYASLEPFPGRMADAFMIYWYERDRRFFDAYNVTHLLAYPEQGTAQRYGDLGLEPAGPVGPFGVHAWRNPHARGWAWLSTEESLLYGEPNGGTVAIAVRDPDAWRGRATAEVPAWLHLAAPAYRGWTLTARHQDGETVVAPDGARSVFLPRAGEWAFERLYKSPALSAPVLGVSFLALLLSILGIFVRFGHAGWLASAGRPEGESAQSSGKMPADDES